MADDLIVKFFQQDLSPAEEEALSQRLLHSTEDAQRFGQHAETSYHYFGLPEPKWRKGGPSAGFLSAPGLKVFLGLGLAVVAGAAGWWVWRAVGTPAVLSANLPQATNPAPATTGSPSQEGVNPSMEGPAGGEQAPAEKVGPLSPKKAAESVPPAPLLTPVSVADPASYRPHSNLEVLVHRARTGPVTVEVLTAQGDLAALLYQGTLPAGNWSFDWNGKLGNGTPAPAGTYQIQMRTDTKVQGKEIVIH